MPPARAYFSTAYDLARARLVLFGGSASDQLSHFNDTWEYDGTTWIQVHPATSPAGRRLHVMAYDAARRRVVLFGGTDASVQYTDTWEYDGTNWHRCQPVTWPPARVGSAAVHDQARRVVVVFGGLGGRNDTWAWDGTNWAQQNAVPAPPGRGAHCMAYDAPRQRVVVFGGEASAGAVGDTWELDGTIWHQCAPATAPPARRYAGMVSDARRGRVVLFGGQTASGDAKTWEWDGTNWAAVAAGGSPADRFSLSPAYDVTRGRVVQFGGAASNGVPLADTWEYDGTNWAQVGPVTVSPPARYASAMAYHQASQRTLLFGGLLSTDLPLADTWDWSGARWTNRTPSNPATSPTSRFWHAMAYDPPRSRTVLFGGFAPGNHYSDVWEWSGSSWTQRLPATSPSPGASHNLAYDAARGRMLLFGGTLTTSETWSWDGTAGNWSLEAPATSPPAGWGFGMASDLARSRVVVYGDCSSRPDATPWEWDGTNWASRAAAPGIEPGCGYRLVYDTSRRRVVYSEHSSRMVDWNGSAWTAWNPVNPPPERSYPALSYDVLRGQTVMFGGWTGAVPLSDTWELPSNRPPTVTASVSPAPAYTGQLVTLSAAFNDPDGDTPTWRWHQTFGPATEIGCATCATAQVRPAVAGEYGFEVVASDGHDGHAYALGALTVLPNQPPTWAVATTSASTTTPGTPVTLDGAASDPDGNTLVYSWTLTEQPHGGDGLLTGAGARTSTLTATRPGRYTVTLTVGDGRGGTATASVTVTVAPPGTPFDVAGSVPAAWGWVRRDGPTPGKRAWPAAAYDPVLARTVLLGGCSDTSCPDDTWLWEGCTWTQVAPSTGPGSRLLMGLAHDSTRRRLVVFGGRPQGWPANPLMSDTWEFDGSTWLSRTPAHHPSARDSHAMAFDAKRGRVVLFGGNSGDRETWEWDGTDWAQKAPATSPPPRIECSLAYDSLRQRVVLHGGGYDDTWEYDGTNWVRIATVTAPPVRGAHNAMAYDAIRGRVVLFGGHAMAGQDVAMGDTWEYDGQNWAQKTTATAPSPRYAHAVSWDSLRSRLVVYGGRSGAAGSFAPLGDTWEHDGTNWAQVGPVTVSPPGRIAHALAYDSTRLRTVLFGGYDPNGDRFGDTWEYDGSRWTNRSPSTSPAARADPALAYDEARNSTVLFSGDSGSNDTWGWDGTAWLERHPPEAPSSRSHHTLAFLRSRGTVVLYGGVLSPDTWQWDGASWLRSAGLTQYPSAIAYVPLAYDPIRERILAFGGMLPQQAPSDETWEYDGTRWQRRLPTSSPGPLLNSPMVWDSARNRAILLGGSASTWEWDGTSWAQVLPGRSSPSGVTHQGMTYDSTRRRAVAFGGWNMAGHASQTWELPSNRPPRLTATVAPVVPVTDHDVVLTAAFNDADGDSPTWRWFQTFGPAVDLRGETTAQAKFRVETPGKFGFEVVADDGHDGHAYALATVDVVGNRAPIVSVAPNPPTLVNTQVVLAGTGVDPDGDGVRFLWLPEAGNPIAVQLSNATSNVASFTPTAAGTYRFQLTVTDSFFVSASATASVRVDASSSGAGDHAASPADTRSRDTLVFPASPATGLTTAGAIATLDEKDWFCFAARRGYLYDLELASGSLVAPLLQLYASDGSTRLDEARGATGSTVRIADFRPGSDGTCYLRVSSDEPTGSGSYHVSVRVRREDELVPPAVRVALERSAGGYQAKLQTAGTAVPLSDLNVLLAYDGARLLQTNTGTGPAAADFQSSFPPTSPTLLALALHASPSRPIPATGWSDLAYVGLSPRAGVLPGSEAASVLSVRATNAVTSVELFRPTADAGLARSLLSARLGGGRLALDALRSSDPNQPGRGLTYRWGQVAGPTVVLDDATAPTPSFAAAGPGLYRFSLAVANGVLESPPTSVTVGIDLALLAPAVGLVGREVASRRMVDLTTAAMEVTTATTLLLDATSSRAPGGGRLSYRWTQLEGPELDLSSARETCWLTPPLAPGHYVLKLEVWLEAEGGKLGARRGAKSRPGLRPGPQQGPSWPLDPSMAGESREHSGQMGVQRAVGPLAGVWGQGHQVESSTITPSTSGLTGRPVIAVLDVRRPATRSPRLDLTAFSGTDTGNDLGNAPDLRGAGTLRSLVGRPVRLIGRVTDAVGTGSCAFYWRQLDGPAVRLTQTDETADPQQLGTAAEFTPPTPGVYELDCRARLGASGAELVRRIRVVVGAPGRPLPEAEATVASGAAVPRGAPSGSGWDGGSSLLNPAIASRTRLASAAPLAVATGTEVRLVGAASSGAGKPLTYRWVQVAGPEVTLSNATSPVATFIAPDWPGVRHYAFQLFADDGARGAPAPVVVRVDGGTVAEVVLELPPGLNLVSVPVNPGTTRPYTLEDLAHDTGSAYVAWADGGRMRVWLRGSGVSAPTVHPSKGYLTFNNMRTARTVRFLGPSWRDAELAWEVPRGLALVGCPLGELATRDARSVLSAISGSFAVTWQRGAGGRTCPGLYVEGLGLAPFALAPGRAVLVWSAGGHLP